MTRKVDGSIIGELLLDEQHEWHVGICRLEVEGDDVLVHGETGTRRVSTDVWKPSMFGDGLVKDLTAIAEEVNEVIEAEYEEL